MERYDYLEHVRSITYRRDSIFQTRRSRCQITLKRKEIQCTRLGVKTWAGHRASSLFELGELEDAETDESFILRLNTLVECWNEKAEKNVPPDLASAISSSGKPDRRAELVLFGNWLLLEGHPSLDKQPGPSPDFGDTLKCVAVCLAEIRAQSLKRRISGLHQGEPAAKTR